MRPPQRRLGPLEELQTLCSRWEAEPAGSAAFLLQGGIILEVLANLLAEPASCVVDGDDGSRLLRLLAYVLSRADGVRPLSLILRVVHAAAGILVPRLGRGAETDSLQNCCLHCVHAFAGVCDQIRRAEQGHVDTALSFHLCACSAALFRAELLSTASAASKFPQWERLLEFLAESYPGAVATITSTGDTTPHFPALPLCLNLRIFPLVAKLRFVDAVGYSLQT